MYNEGYYTTQNETEREYLIELQIENFMTKFHVILKHQNNIKSTVYYSLSDLSKCSYMKTDVSFLYKKY